MTGHLAAEARRRQTARYSFYGAVIVSVIIVGAWLFVRAMPGPAVAVQRRLTDETLTWRCRNNHTFTEGGSTRRLPCPECGQKSDIEVVYACREHGEKHAMVRMTRDESGNARVSHVSHRRGVWDPVQGGIPCPDCGRFMGTGKPSPFADR